MTTQAPSSFGQTPVGRIEILAHAPLPTHLGTFELYVFRWTGGAPHPGLSDEHLALVMGDVKGGRGVPVRVHSECLTGEVFGSLKCDCRPQLDEAKAEIARRGRGIVLYLRQEGRGIGLANKIRAYALQALGADTVEANELLHLPVDARQYDMAAAMLRELGVESIELMTNNPRKIDDLRRLGVIVEKRIPMLVVANPFSAPYLDAKRRRLQHEIPSSAINPKVEPDTGKEPFEH